MYGFLTTSTCSRPNVVHVYRTCIQRDGETVGGKRFALMFIFEEIGDDTCDGFGPWVGATETTDLNSSFGIAGERNREKNIQEAK